MKRIVALALALALLLGVALPALAEGLSTYRELDLEDFSIELAPGEQAERFTRVSGEVFLRVTRPEDSSTGYNAKLEAVWENDLSGFGEMRQEIAQTIATSIMDRDVLTLQKEGANVSSATLLMSDYSDSSTPKRLTIVYQCNADFSVGGYGLNGNLFVMKVLFADSHFGTYTFTARSDAWNLILEFGALLDTIEWKTAADQAATAQPAIATLAPDGAATPIPTVPPVAPAVEGTPVPTVAQADAAPAATIAPQGVYTVTGTLQYDRFSFDTDASVNRGTTEKTSGCLFLSARPTEDSNVAFHALWMHEGYDFAVMHNLPRQFAVDPIQEAVLRLTKKQVDTSTRKILVSRMDDLEGQPVYVFTAAFYNKSGQVNLVMKLTLFSSEEMGTYVFAETANTEEQLALLDPYLEHIHWGAAQ